MGLINSHLNKLQFAKNSQQGSSVNSHILAIMSKLAYCSFDGLNILLPINNTQRINTIKNINANKNPKFSPMLLGEWMCKNNKKNKCLLGKNFSKNCGSEFNKMKNEWFIVGQIDRPCASIVHLILRCIYKDITASVTVFQNKNTSEVVLAFRGTNRGTQLIVDDLVGWGLLAMNPEAKHADFFTKGVKLLHYSRLPFDESRISLTGHSLGGFLALVATAELLSKKCKISSVETFNGLGFRHIHNLSIPKALRLLIKQKDVITHHRTKSDLLASPFGFHPGHVYSYDCPYHFWQVKKSHSISNFLEKI